MRPHVCITIAAVILLLSCAGQSEKEMTIGVIAPMSGPAAIWGGSLRDGMELAREDLAGEGIRMNIVYEDNRLDAQTAISAFHRLTDIERADVIVSAISRTSVPLIPLAEQKRVPLLLTAVSSQGVANASKGVLRFYPSPEGYVLPHFEQMPDHSTAALLIINDEYGTSVEQAVLRQLFERGIEVLVQERFEPGTTDFRTPLLKIKAKDPDAIFYAGEPAGIVSTLHQKQELGLDSEFYELSVLLMTPSLRSAAGPAAEGAHTIAFPFALGLTGDDFRERYKKRYDQDPFFIASFGYDIVHLLSKASRAAPVEDIMSLQEMHTSNGVITPQPSGELNPQTASVTVWNGTLFAEIPAISPTRQ